jgi:glycine oxidase
MKVLIVGAGAAGLSIGWRLAQRGAGVEILERGLAGRGATWASAGMIAPEAEQVHASNAMSEFAREARARWRDFARELEAASGQSICYREPGSLIAAGSSERARVLQESAAALAEHGAASSWLEPARLREREPLLSGTLHGGLYLKDDAQVDNRAFADALSHAIAKTGARLRERCEVRSLAIEDGRVRGAVTPGGVIESDCVVLACGAWTNLIAGLRTGDLPPVRPAKGQMLACEPPANVTLPQGPIWSDEIYLVPRKDRLFVGATVEDMGYDTSISSEARAFLLGAATRLIPSLTNWRVAEMWAGLRPRTPDDAPVLGATSVDGLYVASGQFRNGILFAPAIAEMLCGLILHGVPSSTDAFDPRRFTAA